MTINELLNEVRANMLDDSVEPFLWSDNILLSNYHKAIEEFCLETYAYSELFTISIEKNVDVYTLPDRLIDIIYFRIEDNELQKLDYDYLKYKKLSTTGTPEYYSYLSDNIIKLYPIPDSNSQASILGYAIPKREAEINVEIPIRKEYHHKLYLGVLAYCYQKNDTEILNPLAEKYILLWRDFINKVNQITTRRRYTSTRRLIAHNGLF